MALSNVFVKTQITIIDKNFIKKVNSLCKIILDSRVPTMLVIFIVKSSSLFCVNSIVYCMVP